MAQPYYSPLGAYGAAQGQQLQQQQASDRIRRIGLSPRQLELNRYWSYYCTTQHDGKKISWDGRKVLSEIERQSIEHSGLIPPGFYDPGGMFDEVPLLMRAPTAPYHLTRVVVNRFTGLLFSDAMQPKISVQGDPKLQSWIEGIIKVSRLWIRCAVARTYGGGQGSVGMSFRFRNGKPVIGVHDPRWCTPTFVDMETGEISALEIRYTYPIEMRNERGLIDQVWFWYRRLIDAQRDVTYKPAPVGEGDEPTWIEATAIQHGFGECPAVWVRNTVTDEVDGEPDCMGEFDAQDAIDRLISQGDQGAVENCDPTLEIDSDDYKESAVKKGSRSALKLEKGGSARYIEMTGSGIDSALKMADVHRRNFLEVVQCVLDFEKGEGSQMTATEIERRLAPMHERGALFREQYGEHGVRPLIGKIVRAAITMRGTTASSQFDPATGFRLVPTVTLPPVRQVGKGGEPITIDREMPPDLQQFTDDTIEIKWPPWVRKGATDTSAAASAAATAHSAQVLPRQALVAYLAPYFDIDDPAEALAQAEQEFSAATDALTSDLLSANQAPVRTGPRPPAPPGHQVAGGASPAHAGGPGAAPAGPHPPGTPGPGAHPGQVPAAAHPAVRTP
jgi:hypothetical protein